MDMLAALWLPILVSAVVVFILSALAWMVMPHHKGDLHGFPDEESMVGAVRGANLAPGQYMYPHCDSNADMKSEAFQKKMNEGPFFTLTMWGGKPNMGKNMGVTFVFYIVVSVFIGYISTLALGADPDPGFAGVFRVAGCAGVMAYAFGGIPHAVWFGRPLRSVVTDSIDSVVYGLVTGAIFAFMWPAAAAPGAGVIPGS